MKRTACLTLLCFLFSFSIAQRKVKLLETIKLGGFTYKIYEEDGYVNTAKERSRFFVFYRKGNSASLCSSFLSTIREDKEIKKGTYRYTAEYIECHEYYFDPKIEADSMMKRYYPDEHGDLQLKEHVRYHNGKMDSTVH